MNVISNGCGLSCTVYVKSVGVLFIVTVINVHFALLLRSASESYSIYTEFGSLYVKMGVIRRVYKLGMNVTPPDVTLPLA